MKVTYNTDQLSMIAQMLDGFVGEIVLDVVDAKSATGADIHVTDILCIDAARVCVFQARLDCEAECAAEIGVSVSDLKTACAKAVDKQVTLDAGGGKIHISCGRLTYHFDYLEPAYIHRTKAAKVAWDVVFAFNPDVFAVGVNAIADLYKSESSTEAGIIFQYLPGTSLTMWDKDRAKLDSVYAPDEYEVKTEATKSLYAMYPVYQMGFMRRHLSGCDACQVKFADNAPLGVVVKKKGVTIGWVFAPRIQEK